MDLGSHENSNSRPDLTIPMPPSFVAGAMAAAAAQAAKIHPGAVVPVPQPANNGNATPPDNKDKDMILKPDGTKKAVRYRECQKNHAAGIGGHALDGCGEFMPNKEDETSMRCAACDCHRNFHRREVEGEKPICDLCKEDDGGTALLSGPRSSGKRSEYGTPHSGPLKKRFRTKFTNEQKERMYVLSEKLGWRIQKHDEAEVAQFCADTGVKRHVLKVWMHNNKHTFGNKRLSPAEPT